MITKRFFQTFSTLLSIGLESIGCSQFVTIETSEDVFQIETFEDSISFYDYQYCGLNIHPERYKVDLEKFSVCFKHKYKPVDIVETGQQNGPNVRISKGIETKSLEAPWVVYIQPSEFRGTLRFRCTGVLIGYQWILTSAQCYDINWKDILDKSDLLIYAGSNIEMEGVKKTFDRWFRHPDWTEGITPWYDVGLIKISEPFNKSDPNINTICLPKKYYINTNPMNATFFGYGLLGQDRPPKVLRKLDVKLEAARKCWSGRVLCRRTSAFDDSLCLGDSGGPLIQYVDTRFGKKAMLIGIAQGYSPVRPLPSCPTPRTHEWWASVPLLMDWILEMTTKYR